MSLARYLSKLGALLTSDGKVPAAALATGAVTADAVGANTITLAKLARVGTAGHVLTSNGAGSDPSYQALPAGGVTSLNGQTGAITNTSDGAIGSYVVASTTASGTTAYAANATVAGSSLIRYSATTAPGFQYGSAGNFSSAGLSGTWRHAGGRVASSMEIWGNTDYRLVSLWVRIS